MVLFKLVPDMMTSICLVSAWRIIVLVNIDTFNADDDGNDELENGDDDDDDDSDDELENDDDV